MFGCDKYNIKPDLVSLAKVRSCRPISSLLSLLENFPGRLVNVQIHMQALSSAYMPIGAILMSQEVADVIYSQSNKLGTFLVLLNVGKTPMFSS